MRSTFILGLAALAAGLEAGAARPLVTEDAHILEPKACQVEAWIAQEDATSSRRSWLVPACNPWSEGGAEIAVGFARNREEGRTFQSEQVVQAKTLFRPAEPNDWGVGLVAGIVRHRQADGSGELYATIPFTVSTRDDKLLFHANVGWAREQDTRRDLASWALAVEGQVAPRLTLLAEAFGVNEGRPSYQAGFRFEATPRVLLDATIGNRFGSGERTFTVGIHVDTAPFLP